VTVTRIFAFAPDVLFRKRRLTSLWQGLQEPATTASFCLVSSSEEFSSGTRDYPVALRWQSRRTRCEYRPDVQDSGRARRVEALQIQLNGALRARRRGCGTRPRSIRLHRLYTSTGDATTLPRLKPRTA
jgi:hypothetical protein